MNTKNIDGEALGRGIAVVTGASSGLGKVYADRLAKRDRDSKMVFKGHRHLEHRFCPVTTAVISATKQPHARGNSLILVVLTLWLAGCNNQPPGAHALPAADVTISKPVQKEVVNWNEFTGRTAAVKLVNITPRVSGYIVNIPFKEGDIVHKGDLLFQIDPRPYQDANDQASGQLQQAKANQQLQDLTFGRQQHLRETGVIAKEDYDTAFSNKVQSAAQVLTAQATLNAAQLNLEFTHVTSPVDGRVSRQLVNIGNLVQADSTQLTTVVSIDPIYVYFSMDELAALSYQRLVLEGKLASSQDGKVPIHLQLQDETGFLIREPSIFRITLSTHRPVPCLSEGHFRTSMAF